MSTEQLRAEFEAWWESIPVLKENKRTIAEKAYQAGRAALQSQSNHDTTLFCDLKTDEEKSAFFLTGRGYETGVIAQVIQNDVAMAYHRCSEYRKELEALQSKDQEDAERYRWLRKHWFTMTSCYAGGRVEFTTGQPRYSSATEANVDEAIDHARRVEEK